MVEKLDSENCDFISRRARAEFWVFCVATFCTFFTTSTTAYLSVILASTGMSNAGIGTVLSSPLLPATLSTFFAGALVSRSSAVRVTVVGQGIILIAFASFQVTFHDIVFAAISYAALMVGVGVFFSAGLIYAKGKLAGPRTAYLFGIYSCMLILPNVLGQPAAEWYFSRFGTNSFFLINCIPALVGLLLVAGFSRDAPSAASGVSPNATYLSVLTNRSVVVPYVSTFVVGVVWSFVPSYMSLILHQHKVPTAFFFPAYTATLILSRLSVLRWLATKPKNLVVASGLLTMGVSFLLVFSAPGWPYLICVAGAAFGFGYSMTFPVLGVWISDQLKDVDQIKSVTLFGTIFNFGIFLLPLLVSQVSASIEMASVLAVLGSLAVIWSTIIFLSPHRAA